jgi:hypothetical protein
MLDFLVKEFGDRQGKQLYEFQQKTFSKLIMETKGKTKSQMKTLTKTILPRVALYQILYESSGNREKSLDILDKYMTQVGKKMNYSFRKMQRIPGFYHLFRRISVYAVSHSENWTSEVIKNDKESFKYNIKKCLWLDACVENGCPELCRCFCGCDNIIYDSLSKVTFTRTGTLALGNECCDFSYRNPKSYRSSDESNSRE